MPDPLDATLREMLATHGIESVPKGTVFEPANPEELVCLDARAPAEIDCLPEGTRILVVEDNVVNQRIICRLLESMGAEVVVAVDGVDALDIFEESAYSLVLMDCQMPRLDGYETTRRLRQTERKGRIPIIALTASAMPEDRERCIASGMDDYLSKPVRRPQLAKVLDRWLLDRDGEDPGV